MKKILLGGLLASFLCACGSETMLYTWKEIQLQPYHADIPIKTDDTTGFVVEKLYIEAHLPWESEGAFESSAWAIPITKNMRANQSISEISVYSLFPDSKQEFKDSLITQNALFSAYIEENQLQKADSFALAFGRNYTQKPIEKFWIRFSSLPQGKQKIVVSIETNDKKIYSDTTKWIKF